MKWTLRDYLDWLKSKGRIIEVNEEFAVDDLPEAIEFLSRTQNVVWFKNIKGYRLSVVANLLPSVSLMEKLLEDAKRFGSTISNKKAKQEIAFEGYDELIASDLRKILPILHHYEADVGPYITSGVTHSVNPITGVIARGIHRLQWRGESYLGIALLNPPLTNVLSYYSSLGKEFPVAITIGHHPIIFMYMAMKAKDEVDKLDLAISLCGSLYVFKTPLYKIEVPAGVEIVMEGKVDPFKVEKDGPLGEANGYYLTLPNTPTIKIERVYVRKDAIYHAVLPNGSETDAYLSFASKKILEKHIKEIFPFVKKIYFVPKCFGSSVIVQVENAERSLLKNLMLFLLSSPMVKKCIIVDEDIDPENFEEVEWAILTRTWADEDVLIFENLKGQAIDPEISRGKICKLGINTAGKLQFVREKVKIKRASIGVKEKLAQYMGGK